MAAPHGHVRHAVAIGGLCFLLYNTNGREIPSYDSQPTRLLAREIARHGTFALDDDVSRQPLLAQRQAFGRSLDGHWRSRVSVIPATIAALPAWLGDRTGLVDLDAPLGPGLIAKLTASLLSALSVAFVFLASARYTTTRGAMLVALGYGAGTGVWSTASQTLWQTDVVLATIGAAIAIMAARATHTAASVATCAMLLGIAVAVRPPTVVLAAALGIGLVAGARTRHIWLAAVGLVPVAATIWLNVHWFGNPLGGAPALEALHGTLHGVQGSVTKTPWQGAAGLLISPSRGLLVYSPVVLVAVTSLPVIWHAGWRDLRRWCAVGALLQFAAYACYSVWWGGHTFGPRYLLDILPALAPLAATGLSAWTGTLLRRGLVAVALAWSIAVAATGAFCYPADRWNTTPTDVDRAHRRLWQVRDPQILRCWRTGLSPQNFSFLETREWRSR